MMTDRNHSTHNLFELVKNDVGSGLVARRHFSKGETIYPLSWTGHCSVPSRWTIQRGMDDHADILPIELRYVNHSCNPNVFFDVEKNELRALRDIAPGEEFRYFYPSTEWEMDEPFDCKCGEAQCCGRIEGASRMPPEVLKRYELSSVIMKKLQSRLNEASSKNIDPRNNIYRSAVDGY
ncbi:MAG: SET domain-containing protein [Acidobacteria bacterium]|nr:SET domain-containing protein [Acidobacteriota bacterium]